MRKRKPKLRVLMPDPRYGDPVVTRFITYGVPVPPFAALYMKAVLSHPHVMEWIDKAQDEPWVIEQYEARPA